MSKAIPAYIRAVKKHMHCTGAVKQELTAGLLQKLTQCAEENDLLDMQLLCENFGSPEALAAELMQEVTPEQQKAYRIKKTVLRVIAGVLAAVCLAFVIYVLFDKQKPVIVYEEITDYGNVPPKTTPFEQKGE